MIQKFFDAVALARLLGWLSLAAGAVGLLLPDTTGAGDNGLFNNVAHAALHVLTGLVFLAGAYFGRARLAIGAMAAFFAAASAFGYAFGGDRLFGLVPLNAGERFGHLLLAVFLVAWSLAWPFFAPQAKPRR